MPDVRPLVPAHAAQIARLEARYHDESLADGEKRLRILLEEAAYQRLPHSFGLFDREDLVGYLLCYGIEPTRLPDSALEPEQQREVIYIDDLTILEPYRRYFTRLFGAFVASLKEHQPGRAVEATSIQPMIEHWTRHSALAKRLGYRQDQIYTLDEYIDGHQRSVIRWESLTPLPDIQERLRTACQQMDQLPFTRAGRHFHLYALVRPDQLALLEPWWDRLLRESPGAPAYQSLAYQKTWLRDSCDRSRLLALLIFEEDELVGIAPMRLEPRFRSGRTEMTLQFIGHPDDTARPVFLFGQRCEDCMHALVYFLRKKRQHWDRVRLFQQYDPQQLECCRLLISNNAYLLSERSDRPTTFIELTGSWDQYLDGRDVKLREQIKAARQALEAKGSLRIESWRKPEAVLAAIERHGQLMAQHQGSEQRTEEETEEILAWYSALARRFSALDQFEIRQVFINENIALSTFGIQFDGVHYSLTLLRGPEFRSVHEYYLRARDIEAAFALGLKRYEVLGGDRDPAWLPFATARQETLEIQIYPQNLRNFLRKLWLQFHALSRRLQLSLVKLRAQR